MASAFDVIIPCHNYGKFLPAAIKSARQNGVDPVVINDRSTDNTEQVCKDLGVVCHNVDFGDVVLSRKYGLDHTHADYVCFLDADDKLSSDYVAEAIKAFQDPNVGIVYTDLQTFGESIGRVPLEETDLREVNYIHAGSAIRREALVYSEVLLQRKEPLSLEDWELWREVTRMGWKAVKSPAIYWYRKHHGSMSQRIIIQKASYFELYAMSREEVTIVLPLSGRYMYLDSLFEWVRKQTWPKVRLLVIDSSGDPEFGKLVKDKLTGTFTYVQLDVPDPRSVDKDRTRTDVYDVVRRTMPKIYLRASREILTTFALIVEDDIIPPLDVIERLLRSMNRGVAAISGVYRSRYQDAYVVWKNKGPITQLGTGVEVVEGSGFGCLLVTKMALESSVFHAAYGSNFDPNFCIGVKPKLWLVDWSVHCLHAGIPV